MSKLSLDKILEDLTNVNWQNVTNSVKVKHRRKAKRQILEVLNIPAVTVGENGALTYELDNSPPQACE